ncbi:hypothetical protein [Mycobacterium colombiense]|uniref:Uncharacterized protein n=1 Tax=Mycobacterium colombiense TaxID=339268 RepID=A0A1A2YNZ0_9MYCO|nr:hypothetical protein [Mycobacterium colombiense]OBI39720.1 hypothetical protein A5708_03035 [Mycobacterium colombiense]
MEADDARFFRLQLFWLAGLNGMWMVVPAISGYLLLQLTKDPHYDARAAGRDLLGKRDTALEVFARSAIRA